MVSPQEIFGFQVLSVLGHGARSTIYAVRESTGAQYALKHVARLKPTDQRFLDQAILEHDIASRFNHPLLRRSFKILRERSLLRTSDIAVVMELVDGVTLEKHKSFSIALTCRICQQIAIGLTEMHKAGYVHADIKPNNVMIAHTGEVKIIDFGQSCPMGTVKERIQGTPDYIAPEQVHRRRLTARTDVFNLGATMYWLFTGQHIPTALPGKRPDEIGLASSKVPPAIELNPEVPPALSSLVTHCIAPRASERPVSMQQVHDRIGLALSQIDNESRR